MLTQKIINRSWHTWGASIIYRLDIEGGIVIMTEDEADDWKSGEPQPVDYSEDYNVIPVYEDREDTDDPYTFNHVELVRK